MKPRFAPLRATALLAALTLGSLGLSAASLLAGPVKVDAKIPAYKKTSGVTGNLNFIGSDTLNDLMTLRAEGFKAQYLNVKIQIEGKGSSTAPPALIEGTAQIGPMSREMKSSETDAFEKKYGYKPTDVKVSIDALAVYVHKNNPIKGFTMQQVDGIFSSTRKAGGSDITTWGQVGLTGEWAPKALSLYGRNSASGTYGYFKDDVLMKGDYKPSVKEQPGSSAVVQSVGTDLGGIGYSGIGYMTSAVRAVPVAKSGDKFMEANYANCLNGDYPIARFLNVYINKKPGAPADKLVGEFIKYIASKEGQEVVVKGGYFPLPPELAGEGEKLVAGNLSVFPLFVMQLVILRQVKSGPNFPSSARAGPRLDSRKRGGKSNFWVVDSEQLTLPNAILLGAVPAFRFPDHGRHGVCHVLSRAGKSPHPRSERVGPSLRLWITGEWSPKPILSPRPNAGSLAHGASSNWNRRDSGCTRRAVRNSLGG